MDHSHAQNTRASERYLLGEMTELERFEFEDHYFQCDECAGDVRASHALVQGIKEVGREFAASVPAPAEVLALQEPRRRWFSWLAPGSLLPSAAALGLAVVAGYQAWIVIPGLRGSRAMSPVVLRAAARGEEQTLDLRKDEPFSFLSLDVNSADPGTPLKYDVVAPGGEVRITSSAEAPPLGSPLIVLLTNTDLREMGAWSLVLRTQKGAEIARYPFSVQVR